MSKARKASVLGLVALIASVAALMLAAPQSDVSAAPGDGAKSIEEYTATVAAVGPSTLTIEREGESIELLASGAWLAVTGEARKLNWSEAASYLKQGEALVIAASISRGNTTVNLLLGIKQGDLVLVRLAFLKRCAIKHLHTRTYMSVRGEIVEKGGNYLMLSRGNHTVLVITGGTWVKAGEGEVTWEQASASFNPGDTVRVFCHNILVLNEEFAKAFGFKAIVWGYSGAIINLTNGTALSKA